jgi:hypothetical protein
LSKIALISAILMVGGGFLGDLFLAKLVWQNLSCLIHAMQESGVDPNFGVIAL